MEERKERQGGVFLSVVIPAYNEEKSIGAASLEKVEEYLRKRKYSWEVLVVDDGSTDKTVELAESYARKDPNFRILAEPHRGKGGTVIAGMLAAKGEIILFTDMDQATPIEELAKILPKFEEGYEVVIGSRSGREGAPLVRKLMAMVFSLLRKIILGLPHKDTQCGFKAFKKEAAKAIFKKLKVFAGKKVRGAAVTAGFDLEVLYIARKLGFRVAEVPVAWNYGERKKVNPVRDSLDAVKDILKVRVNSFLGKYNV